MSEASDLFWWNTQYCSRQESVRSFCNPKISHNHLHKLQQCLNAILAKTCQTVNFGYVPLYLPCPFKTQLMKMWWIEIRLVGRSTFLKSDPLPSGWSTSSHERPVRSYRFRCIIPSYRGFSAGLLFFSSSSSFSSSFLSVILVAWSLTITTTQRFCPCCCPFPFISLFHPGFSPGTVWDHTVESVSLSVLSKPTTRAEWRKYPLCVVWMSQSLCLDFSPEQQLTRGCSLR